MNRLLILLSLFAPNIIISSEKKRSLEIDTIYQEKKRTKINYLRSYDLNRAIENGDVRTVRSMLESNPELANIKYSNRRPLHTAAARGNINIVETLIEFKADTNGKDDNGCAPLHAACKYGNVLTAKLLVKNGAQLDHANIDGFTPLHLASIYGYYRTMQFLLDNKADANAQTNREIASIGMAAWYGHRKCTEILLRSDCKIQAADAKRRLYSPIQAAMHTRNYNCAKLIREYLVKKIDKDDACPICLGDCVEIDSSDLTVLDCCLKPICKGCKYAIKKSMCITRTTPSCPNCRNPYF